ncbi:MAG: TonB-dependent receptor [Flavobacteriales bacterium]|jgi:hypothetical protein|nr:TonB-dependent receptor [Flavobacteriales bacterium]
MKFNKLFFFGLATGLTVSTSAQIDTLTATDSIADFMPNLSSGSDLMESESQSQNVSGLLQSSRDVYSRTAGFNFSAARFRLRGYSSENTLISLGGMPGNDPESGWAIWSYWGGLNDITRYPENVMGIASSTHQFGGIGGSSFIDLKASTKRAGSRFSYALTNRSYDHRIMFTHNTGVLKNGWSLSASLSSRFADGGEGYVEGTNYSAMSYFLSVGKKLNEKHELNLAAFGAPTVQGRRGIATQEIYDLTENNFYNSYWGYQTDPETGETVKRNARVRNNHKTYITLSDDWEINKKSKLSSSVYAVVGRTGSSNVNWNNAADPRPDYYKNLPSYFRLIGDEEGALEAENAWANDPSTRQLDWDAMYLANSKNLHTVDNANGSGTAETGMRSKYILEDARVDPRQYGANLNYQNKLNEKLYLTAGLRGELYTSRNYKKMKDLLGGEYWVDVDQFAERDFADPAIAQNDISTPNKIIRVGDVFGYDYKIHVNSMNAFAQLDYKTNKVDSYIGVQETETVFWREGILANGKFPEESAGVSDKHKFTNFMVKAGATYKITGRHYLQANVQNGTRAPFSRASFISPRTRDQVVDNLESTKILSGDVNYVVRYPNLKARATAFYTQMDDQIWARSFYHDEYLSFVNYAMTNVDQLFTGVEVGFEAKVATVWEVSGAFTKAQYLYTSRPEATITTDNSQELIAEDKLIYLKNYHVGGMPETAASIGLKYNSPKYWYAGANFNYFADIYLSPNPDRRTAEAIDGYFEGDPQIEGIIAQEKLENGYNINIFGGKSFKFSNNTYLRLNLMVNNILDNTDFKTGGFEQLRYDSQNIDKFPSKYGYMYGRSYFLMVSYLF